MISVVKRRHCTERLNETQRWIHEKCITIVLEAMIYTADNIKMII